MAVKPTVHQTRRMVLADRMRKIMQHPVGRFLRFASASIICSVLDQVIAWVLFAALKNPMAGLGFLRILTSTVIARCISLTLNYILNRRLVFSLDVDDPEWRRAARRESLPRFVALSIVILTLSTIGVYLLNSFFGIKEWLAKIVVDFTLFFLNYNVQRKWVFKDEISINPNTRRR